MTVDIRQGDCLASLRGMAAGSAHTCATSPPYFGLRDYGVEGQIGLEATPDAYVARLVEVFREVRRVLRDDGTLWLNLGDSYAASGRGGGGGSFQDKDVGTKVSADNSRRAPVKGSVLPAGMHESVLGSGAIGRAWVKPPQGFKQKDLLGIPWRVAFALQADGWYLRQDIIWHKPNPMPESVRDRCTKAHEYVFLLAKSERYYFDAEAIREKATSAQGRGATGRGKQGYAKASAAADGSPQQDHSGWTGGDGEHRNKRSVWSVTTKPFKGAHFATFPPDLIEPCVLAGCPAGGTVLDPFGGAGTTGLVAQRHGRNAILCELNPEYAEMARKRIAADQPKTLKELL